jgi:hypothetical protein
MREHTRKTFAEKKLKRVEFNRVEVCFAGRIVVFGVSCIYLELGIYFMGFLRLNTRNPRADTNKRENTARND